MAFFEMKKMILDWAFRKPVTTHYPFEPRQPLPGSRGNLTIQVDLCIFCGACAKRCPTDALTVDRPGKKWHIDRLRCITCGACVDCCPKKCLALAGEHSAATVTRDRETHVHA